MALAPRLDGVGVDRTVTLDDKYEARTGRVLISGIESLVRLVLEQRRLDEARGLDTAAFVSGYEGSPLGGLDLELHRATRHLERLGVVFRPGLNEELAATAAAGTQLLGELPGRRHDGIAAFWYGKNPGLDRAADAIRHGMLSGTAPLGGVVALVGDDPDCKSSTLPSSCGPMVASIGMPLLAPSAVDEIVPLGLHAVALSRACGLWTSMQIVSDLADAAATVEVGDPALVVPPPVLSRTHRPATLLGPTARAAEENLYAVRLPAASAYAAETGLNRATMGSAGARRVILAGGMAHAAVVRALSNLGLGDPALARLGLRLVQLRMLWPLDTAGVRALVRDADEVLVVEDKGPFVESLVKSALYDAPRRPAVLGSHGRDGAPLLSRHGVVTSGAAAEALAVLLGDDLPPEARQRLERHRPRQHLTLLPSDAPRRTPFFCSGCPHNVSTRAHTDQLVGVGIGCHTMVLFDEERRGRRIGSTQMGGEGAQWIGLSPFTNDPHYVQNLGDGTFFHSGSLAIRAAAAARVDITYKLLFNDAVAMTGGQTPVGRMDVPAVARWLALEGVAKVVITTPEPHRYRGVTLDPVAEVRHRDDLDDVQRELAGVPGVTVIVHDDRCAAEKRRRRARGIEPPVARRLFINRRVCEGCGDCSEKSTCLSVVPVDTEHGRKMAIHQGSCNQDYSCLRGDCPSFVEVIVQPEAGGVRGPAPTPPLPLPDPSPAVHGDEVLVHMPGIGGTGVLTVSRILQMAAHLDGLHSASVDQTGLAQKGGPVISDVRIASFPIRGSVRATVGSLDLLLGMDLLGASEPATLELADPERTVAVVSTSRVQTATMLTDPRRGWPEMSSIAGRIDGRTRQADNRYLDAQWIAEHVSDDHLAANVVLLGAAHQLGLLPMSARSLERAIALNGVAVDENTAAFRWGRAAVVDPGAVQAALEAPISAQGPRPARRHRAARSVGDLGASGLPQPVADLLADRAADLVDYQDLAYGRRFVTASLRVAAIESARCPDDRMPVTTAFAKGLHKLMAYKDEYEVARLHLDPGERARLEAELGPVARTRVQLHPPSLRALGLRRKIDLGPLEQPVLQALRASRRLRGTSFDPFGRTEMRRAERALIDEYEVLVGEALGHLRPETVGAVAAVAALAEDIRGYEAVKQASIDRFRAAAVERMAALTGAGADGSAGGGGDGSARAPL